MGDGMRVMKKLSYGVKTTHFIRQALAGYGGGSAIAAEMAQNADDAGASQLSFRFTADALLVGNNSTFTEEDFSNITEIAGGTKRAETGKIGTWGTGFLSVFHLTDSPELFSAGQHIRFDPNLSELPVEPGPIEQGTRFSLPWRRERTPLSIELETDIWQDQHIEALKEEMAVAIYRLILFLRHVRSIEVYDDKQLLHHVRKERAKVVKVGEDRRELWTIEYRRFGGPERSDTWLYYRGQVPQPPDLHSITIKDRGVALAFPVEDSGWIAHNIPGTLYNFLPTPIQTGYPFHINGAFFPDNNRQTILTDRNTQREKSAWNWQVLEEVGHLFSRVALDIRDQVADARRFYELLPLEPPEEEYLSQIYEIFKKAAPGLAIVFSSRDRWLKPHEVSMGIPGSRLPELAGPYLDVLPTGATQAFRQFLTRDLKSLWLNWQSVVAYLRPHLKPGNALSEAHSMINIREKLETLYSELPSQPHPTEVEQIRQLPLCLGDDGKLYSFGNAWRAGDNARRLLARTGNTVAQNIHLVDKALQTSHSSLLGKLLPEFKGAELVKWLAGLPWPDTPFSLEQMPAAFANVDWLRQLLHFIYEDLKQVRRDLLVQIPFIQSEDGRFFRAADAITFHNRADERRFLREVGLDFVHPAWDEDETIAHVLRSAGIHSLHPRHVVAQLEKQTTSWQQETPAVVSKLLPALYDYFARYSHQLGASDQERLRRLPLCLTQKGRLVAAAGDEPLHLPPVESTRDSRLLAHLDRLELDYLVAGDLVARGRRFLTQVLGLRPLTVMELIRDVIVPNYHDPRLDHDARKDLLQYVHDEMQRLADHQQRTCWPVLRSARLVYCADGEYRLGQDVYFASPALDAVFTSYHHLHPDYGVPVAQPEDQEPAPHRRSPWYWFFSGLGVNEHPTAHDLVQAVERAVADGKSPDEERMDAIRRIYTLLRDEAGKRYLSPEAFVGLRELAWLPASNLPGHWYRPAEVYPPGATDLVGMQAPLLAFREPTVELRELLDMPTRPPLSVVIAHLRASARANEPVKQYVYSFLGASTPEGHKWPELRREAIIWDSGRQRYWRPREVFLGDHRRLFGHRRGYLRPPGGEAQLFLEQVGVREQPHHWNDVAALVEEIAADYKDGQRVGSEDLVLLANAFDHLGRQISIDHATVANRLTPLRALALAPGDDGRLHPPQRIVFADRREILDYFDEGAFPTVAEEGFTEAAYQFLRELGAARLSDVIRRRAHDVGGQIRDYQLTRRLQQLAPAFQRIVLMLREEGAPMLDNSALQEIDGITVYSCDHLIVEYSLDNGRGWQVRGNRTSSEQALYDLESNALFVRQQRGRQTPLLPLARELDRLLFPDNKQSMVLENLLKMKPAEVGPYLDSHGYPHFYEERIAMDEEEESEGLAELGEAGEDLPLLNWKRKDEKQNGERATSVAVAATSLFGAGVESSPSKVDTVEDTEQLEQATGSEEKGADQELLPAAGPEPGVVADRDGDETDRAETTIPEETAVDLGLYEAEPEPGQTADTRVETPPKDHLRKEDDIPVFTGQRTPTVPVLPNNYGRLKEKFGLTQHGDGHHTGEWDEIGNADRVAADAEWEAQEEEREAGSAESSVVSHCRFTLTFQNRYEGFLPLHQRVRRMLDDEPVRLQCQTDYEEWQFDLYVDYEQGVIHNQTQLPRFFGNYNIPAGGIVYLERVHTNTVRLYWKSVESRVENVRCLELLEDGTLSEYEVPAADFPCEISEYVLRAEKRLEDIDALFKQAVDRRGIFETICDVFGEPGRILGYEEIYQGVMDQRMVAKASIDYQLHRRPCFVEVEPGRWQFVTERGSEPSPAQQPAPSRRGQPGTAPVRQRTGVEIRYYELWTEIKQAWQELGAVFHQDGHKPQESLRQVAAALLRLGQRLQTDLEQLEATETKVSDPKLQQLWYNLRLAPDDRQLQRQLAQHLEQQPRQAHPLEQVAHHLAETSFEQREQIFFPLLREWADRAAIRGNARQSQAVYERLQEQHAGDFQRQIAQLAQVEEAREIVAVVRTYKLEERWELWPEIWDEYQEIPLVRRAIQEDIETCLAQVTTEVEQLVKQGEAMAASQAFLTWFEQVRPLAYVWSSGPTRAALDAAWRSLFDGLVNGARTADGDTVLYEQALRLAAVRPLESQELLSADAFLESIIEVAQQLESDAHVDQATLLLEYGLYLVSSSGRQATGYDLYALHEYTGRLYEHLGLFDKAYKHLFQSHRHSTGGAKKTLGHRLHEMHGKREKAKLDGAREQWELQALAVVKQERFRRMVIPHVVKQILHGNERTR